MNVVFIAFGIFYLLVLVIGNILERIRVPWIFGALIIGILYGSNSVFNTTLFKSELNILSTMGMSLLLMLIGFNLDIENILKYKKQISKTTLAMIVLEAIVGSTFLTLVFNVPLVLSGIISISFATVGETALLPILEEFNITKSKVGQTALSIGVFDDIVEIAVFVLAMAYMGTTEVLNNPVEIMTALFFVIASIITFKLKDKIHIKAKNMELYLVFVFATIFILSAVIKSAELLPLITIFLGFILQNITKDTYRDKASEYIKQITMIVFAPFFFFEVGLETDITVLRTNIITMLALTLIIQTAKIVSTYVTTHKTFGTKKALLLGTFLSIKFSTSIILLFAMLNIGLITQQLFSILIGVKIIFEFMAPIIIGYLVTHWNIKFEY